MLHQFTATRVYNGFVRVSCVVICLLIALHWMPLSAQIDIFAGDDQSICYESSVDLTSLGAFITGDVDDGNWFTTGDGIFIPSNSDMGVFSTATLYMPGTEDQSSGSFNLILVSDDPDGIGPMIEVSDQLTVSFQNAPALACNNSINVTLNIQCEQAVSIDMLVANPVDPVDRYTIEIMDENGVIVDDNILTSNHIGQDITYTVGHECTQVTCSGSLTVTDNYAPVFVCTDSEIICTMDHTAEDIGLPIPMGAIAISSGDQSYEVSAWDACGIVNLSYTDQVSIPSCNTPLDKIINRTWIATDANGNSSYCSQSILIERITVEDVIFPPHLDGIAQPVLSCSEPFYLDADGHPHPTVTGYPSPTTCNHLDYPYSDTVLPLCGGGYKVLRAWEAIDWCLGETLTQNQIIKVADEQAPSFDCVDDITVNTSPYECSSNLITLSLPQNIEDCSSTITSATVISEDGQQSYPVNDNNGILTVNSLPMGTYEVTYTVTDDCGYASSCTSIITVVDQVIPYPVCNEFTTTSITSNGSARIYAISLDNGSTDNCTIESLEVAKMTDECGFGLQFGPFVDFCCSEVGDSILIALRVTDQSGNSNTCMVTAYVEDKIAPQITCPSNLTISCDTPYDIDDMSPFGVIHSDESLVSDIIINDDYNTGVAGQDGYFTDNCIAMLTESVVEDIACYEGSIVRTFIVTDEFGLQNSCQQTITILNPNPVTENDIIWPVDIHLYGCQEIDADTSVTGIPSVDPSIHCTSVAYEYYDEIFPIADTACVKIIRHWTAYDWCQSDNGEDVVLWTDNQVIALSNNIAPEIASCQDTIVCAFDDACGSAQFDYSLFATDDCSGDNLNYTWSIDFDNDGSIDADGSSNSISIELLYGSHNVAWSVSDQCGNFSNCEFIVVVQDCKAPTPYCYSSITTVLMPTTGEISVFADQFDFGSYDNCTATENLQISFGPNPNNDSVTLTCDDIENGSVQWVELDMYVTDENGNQDFCTVQLVIQDNDDTCADDDPDGIIKGELKTIYGENVNHAQVYYYDVNDISNDSIISTDEGQYITNPTFDQVPYYVIPEKHDEVDNGVTTIDLLLSQRHILGFQEFDDPYKLIAGDMNRDGKISGSDIVMLRKIVLGIITELPANTPPWRFIDSDFIFEDESQPWIFPEERYIQPLVDTVDNQDFIVVKMGDVNESYDVLDNVTEAQTRNSNTYPIEYNISTSRLDTRIDFVATNSLDLDAYQLQLDFHSPIKVSHLLNADGEELATDNYIVDRSSITLLDFYLEPKTIQQGQVIFSIILNDSVEKESLSISLSELYKCEVYQDGEPMPIILERNNSQEILNVNSYYLVSNPSTECIISTNGKSSPKQITVIDKFGREIYNVTNEAIASLNTISLPPRIFIASDIYYIKIEDDNGSHLLKYIHIK